MRIVFGAACVFVLFGIIIGALLGKDIDQLIHNGLYALFIIGIILVVLGSREKK